MECTLCLCVVSSNERLIGYDKLCEICCSACIVSPLLNPVSTLYKGRFKFESNYCVEFKANWCHSVQQLVLYDSSV